MKNFLFKYLTYSTIATFTCLSNSVLHANSTAIEFLDCAQCGGKNKQKNNIPQASVGFTEDWSQGISPDRWYLYRKQWGGDNNGAVPELVSLSQDTVNGVLQNVLVLTAQGDLTTSSIMGVQKVGDSYVASNSPNRVGACIATYDSFASGTYEVTMKIGKPNSAPTSAPIGLVPAIWTFHYEEHYPAASDPNGLKMNPDDPQYQPKWKEGNPASGYYSTVNSEIDCPELGRNGNFNLPGYNAYVSEIVGTTANIDYSKFGIDVLDGNYHTYRTEWETNLKPTNLTDDQVISNRNYYYGANNVNSPYQGVAVVKQGSVWYAYNGKSATFYVDGIKVGAITKNVSPVSARLTIGAWFPDWAGLPNWDQTQIYVANVVIAPANDVGDVTMEPETYPLDGLVSP